jgi:hypothetical protein
MQSQLFEFMHHYGIKTMEAPAHEQPKVEQPKVEQPKVEQPKVEQPTMRLCVDCKIGFKSKGATRCVQCSYKCNSTCRECKYVYNDNGATDKVCPKCMKKLAQARAQAERAAARVKEPRVEGVGVECNGCAMPFVIKAGEKTNLCIECVRQQKCEKCEVMFPSRCEEQTKCAVCSRPDKNAKCEKCEQAFYTSAGSTVCSACVQSEPCDKCKRVFRNYRIKGREQLCSKCAPKAVEAVAIVVPEVA